MKGIKTGRERRSKDAKNYSPIWFHKKACSLLTSWATTSFSWLTNWVMTNNDENAGRKRGHKFHILKYIRNIKHVGFEIFTEVKVILFQVLVPCRLICRCPRFERTYCLHLRGYLPPERWHLSTRRQNSEQHNHYTGSLFPNWKNCDLPPAGTVLCGELLILVSVLQ
jgi:hypothetical protein